MRLVLGIFLSFLLVFSLSFADEVEAGSKKAVHDFGNAVVWVKFYQPYEDWDGTVLQREVMTTGVFFSDKGDLFLRGHIHLQDFKPTDFRVQYPDGTEGAATYLGKDESLNVAFARVKKKRDDFQYVDFSKSCEPFLGMNLFVLSRRPPWEEQALEIKCGRLISVIPGLRRGLLLQGIGFEQLGGCPVFSEKGIPLGVIGFDMYVEEGGTPSSFPGYPLIFTSKELLNAKPKKGKKEKNTDFVPGWVGIMPMPVDEKLSLALGLKGKKGVYVSSIIPDSPAQKAKMQSFDVILSIDGVTLEGDSQRMLSDFSMLIRKKGAGEVAKLKLWRNGKTIVQKIDVVPEPLDSSRVSRLEFQRFGFTVRRLTWDFYLYRNYPWEKSGVVVDRVVAGTSADLAEMMPDDVIVSFAFQKISTIASIVKANSTIKWENDKIVLEVIRDGRRKFLILELFDSGLKRRSTKEEAK